MQFLASLNLMDYSLVVGIHDRDAEDSEPVILSSDNDLDDEEDEDNPASAAAIGGGERVDPTPPDSPQPQVAQCGINNIELDPLLEPFGIKCSESNYVASLCIHLVNGNLSDFQPPIVTRSISSLSSTYSLTTGSKNVLHRPPKQSSTGQELKFQQSLPISMPSASWSLWRRSLSDSRSAWMLFVFKWSKFVLTSLRTRVLPNLCLTFIQQQGPVDTGVISILCCKVAKLCNLPLF